MRNLTLLQATDLLIDENQKESVQTMDGVVYEPRILQNYRFEFTVRLSSRKVVTKSRFFLMQLGQSEISPSAIEQQLDTMIEILESAKRMPPLSEALDDLFRKFQLLKGN